MKNVLVLGASDNPDRYSYIAIEMLTANGFNVIPVHPRLKTINEIKVYNSLEEVIKTDIEIDTITLYLSENKSEPIINDIVSINPKRIILNPGTESNKLEAALDNNEIYYEKACTLVLIRTGQF